MIPLLRIQKGGHTHYISAEGHTIAEEFRLPSAENGGSGDYVWTLRTADKTIIAEHNKLWGILSPAGDGPVFIAPMDLEDYLAYTMEIGK